MTDSTAFSLIEKVIHDTGNLTLKRLEAIEKIKEIVKQWEKQKQPKFDFGEFKK